MSSYCLRCKAHTGDLEPKLTKDKNGRSRRMSYCDECEGKKYRYVAEKKRKANFTWILVMSAGLPPPTQLLHTRWRLLQTREIFMVWIPWNPSSATASSKHSNGDKNKGS